MADNHSLFYQAQADIRNNLWCLSDHARSQITNWFLSLMQDAYSRGRADEREHAQRKAAQIGGSSQ